MQKNNNLNIRSYLLAVCLTMSVFSVSTAQNQAKKVYNENLDSWWSKVTSVYKLSRNGIWAVIGEGFENGEIKFTLVNTKNIKQLKLINSDYPVFSNDSKWLAMKSHENKLKLINLQNLHQVTYENVSSFEFSNDGRYLAYILIKQNGKKSLNIIQLKDNDLTEIEDAIDYKWNPAKNMIIVHRNRSDTHTIFIYDVPADILSPIAESTYENYSNLMWNESGNTFVFFSNRDEDIQIYYYNLIQGKKVLANSRIKHQFPDILLSNRYLSISSDGTKVFFYRKITDKKYEEENDMEVWDTKDAWIFPAMQYYYKEERQYLLTLWNIKRDTILEVADELTPSAQFNPNHSHALVFDKLLYEPQYKQYPYADLYLKNFYTGDKELVTQKQYTGYGYITLSPQGRFVSFFKEKEWWVYDSKLKKTTNLTKEIESTFEDINDYPADDKEPYGNPGWSIDEKYIILHDQYDIWLMKPDGSFKKRITRGKENKIQYRIIREIGNSTPHQIELLIHQSGVAFDLSEGLLISMLGEDMSTGFALLKNQNLKTIIYESQKLDNAFISVDNSKIVFRKSWFNNPTGIYVSDLLGKSKLLLQSNKELLDYDLGTQEWISYETDDHKSLKGLLIYPSHFNPNKKYPMITWIYENKYTEVHRFVPPSYFNEDGFNILKYVTNGYFVFLPGIAYTSRESGESALHSVEAGVFRTLENKAIDKDRLGLIGHSFGGYETTYIMTHTNIFATGVAGAPITDLSSYYHDVWWEGKNTEQMWRMENQQFRMNGTFYELKEQYLKNSPLNFVENLNRPLLLWSGKDDYNVNWDQSVYLFLAMKRLKKEGKLLLFNNEPHTITNSLNKEKLSKEIFKWFNFYLKP